MILQRRDESLRREAIGFAAKTLSSIAASGIYDVVGGGVHRYAIDAAWQVPDFEKRLLAQALMARALLEVTSVSRDGRFAAIAEHIFGFV